MLNHEKEIIKLRKEVDVLKKQIKLLIKSKESFLPLTQAAKILDVTPTVLRNRCAKKIFTEGKEYKRNGNRYLINPNAVSFD